MDESRFFEDLDARHSRSWPIGIATRPIYPHGPVALTASLRAWAQGDPHRIALDFYGTTLDYLELDRLSDRCAAVLAARGVRQGDRVAVMLDNCPQYYIAFYGILKLGAVYVPINPQLREDEALHILEDAEAVAAIVTDHLAPLLLAARARTGLESVLSTSPAELLPVMSNAALPAGVEITPERHPGAIDFMAAIRQLTDIRQWPDADLDALAALNYTSGTTGLPKGCMHTQRNMLHTAAAKLATGGIAGDVRPGQPSGEVILNFLPLSWIFGESVGLVYPVFTGAKLVLLVRWNAAEVLAAIERCRVTRTFMGVDKLVDLVRHPARAQHDLRSLKQTHVASLNRKLSTELRRLWLEATGSTVNEVGWGMTETHTLNTFTTGMQDNDRDLDGLPVFVGLPVPGTRIKICDFETGELLGIGAEGEVVVSTPSLFKGYWRRPEDTAAVLRDGWFRTGDIGSFDDAGRLRYLGRRKEVLKVRGMNIFATEIEQMIGRHEAVVGCAVLGRPDPVRGQVPVAFVHLEESAQRAQTVTAESLLHWCRERIALHKLPEIQIIDALPVTAVGKVRKTELEARLLGDAGVARV